MRTQARRLLVIGVIVTTIAGVGAAIGLATHPGNPGPPAHQEAPINANVDYWFDNYGVGQTTLKFDPTLSDEVPLPNPLRNELLCTKVFGKNGNLRGSPKPKLDPGHPGSESVAIAIWADANLGYDDFTVLAISGSENFIDGATVSRTDLKVSGQKNQFLHGVEHGDGPAGPVPVGGQAASVFDLSGSDNCFLPTPTDAGPAVGFPQEFDIRDFDILAPGFGSAAQAAILDKDLNGKGRYFYCGSATALAEAAGANENSAPIDAFCDPGSGLFDASVQGADLAPGLYFVEGEIKLSASNLVANVTFVTHGRLDASGSVNSEFRAYTRGLLFMTDFGTKNSKDLGEDALKVGGSTSTFSGGHLFAPNGQVVLSGSRNYYDCTVMGDRVSLSGSNSVIIGKPCGLPPLICSGESVIDKDGGIVGEFTLLSGADICKRYVVVAHEGDPLDPTDQSTITFTPEDNGGLPEMFRGLLTFDPLPSPDGSFFVGLEYDPDNDGPLPAQPLLPCIAPVFTSGLVTSATLPPLESWCLAGGSFVANSFGDAFIPTAQVYGEEDPRFSFK